MIATFNRPDVLQEAIASALAQDGPTEVLVVDDAPGQTTAAMIASLNNPRVQYLPNPVPSGGRPAVVRNLGLAATRGALIHFLDDDDRAAPGFYATARAALAAHPRVGLVFGTVRPFGHPGALAAEQAYFQQASIRARRTMRLGRRWPFVAHMLFKPTLMVCSAAIVRRTAVADAGGFDPALPLLEDVALYTRIIRNTGALYIGQPSLEYRIGPSLMRQTGRDALIAQSARLAHAAYRARYGSAEYWGLKLLSMALR